MGNSVKVASNTDINARHTQRLTEAKSAEKTNNRLDHLSEGCIFERAASEGIQLHQKSKEFILERAKTFEGFQQQREKNTSFDPNQAGNESDNNRKTSKDNQQSSKLNATSSLFTVGNRSRSEAAISVSNQQKLKETEHAHLFQADDEVADKQNETEGTTILVVQAVKETEIDSETSVDNQQKPNTSRRFALSNLRFDEKNVMFRNKKFDEIDGQIEEKLSQRNEASNETEPDKCTSLRQTHDTSSSTSPENCKPSRTLPSVEEIGTRMKSEVSQLTPLKKTEQPVTKSPVMVQESVHEHIEALQIQVRQLKKENESLKIRICRFMSSKLTDNNPEITDLSDKNRPVELCQRYRELYNNEWTDAFEGVREVIGLSDKGGIKLLLDLIMDIYHMCGEKARYDLKYLQEAISTFNAESVQDSNELTSCIKEQKDKRKKQFQKFLPELNKIALYITETNVPKEHIPESKIEPYVVLATELCWLMNIQDPPVYMETNFKKKAPFNKDHYCMYSCTGETNDYLVWPVLFLQKDGPVLCKGYAAPRRYRQKGKKKHHLSKHKTIP